MFSRLSVPMYNNIIKFYDKTNVNSEPIHGRFFIRITKLDESE